MSAVLSRRLFVTGISAFFAPLSVVRAERVTLTTSLQPLGRELHSADVDLVIEALSCFYRVQLVRETPLTLPASAYYTPRARYRADELLDYLDDRRRTGVDRVLGLTAVDISTSKGKHFDWGVLGLATLDGLSCVLSSFRCRRGARDRVHARQRLGKVAVHELGHTFGLTHCPNVGCLMEDAHGTVLTSDREYTFCRACQTKLEERDLLRRPLGIPPWPKPL
jgi:archaemetzincin